MNYPLPSYAAHIWIANGQLCLGFPSPKEGAREHMVTLPLSDKGLAVAIDILREREKDRFNTLGTAGAPCRRQVEDELKRDQKYNEILRAMSVSKSERDEAAKWLEELGL
jgi:hypothetical protein